MKIRKILLAFVLSLVFCSNGFSQTAEEIVAKYIDAVGGKAQWDKFNTEKITGKLSVSNMDFDFISSSKRPNSNYTEVTVQGMKILQGYDGDIGWTVNPMTGSSKAQKMDDDELKSMRDRGIIGGELMNYKELGSSVELVGKEDLEGTEVFNIKLTDKEGQIMNFFIDANNYLLLKRNSKLIRAGKELKSETYFSNYKQVEGVTAAYTIEAKLAGESSQSQKILIDKIEFNVDIDDNIFKMPADDK